MGLPQINIEFNSLAVSAVQRSQRGIVALILADNTDTFDSIEYKTVTDIKSDNWTEENKAYIEQAFLGTPSKVIVERIDDFEGINDALNRLSFKTFNYLAVPTIESADVTTVSSWLIAQRDNNRKTYKAVLPHSVSDHEGIINFTTSEIVVGGVAYTASEYTARIAGLLAGLSLERSATYYVLPEVESIKEHEDADEAIDNGELILISDGEKIKIGRGVNSLTTFTPSKSQEFSKIKIIEGHDLIKDDIVRTFADNYIGKVNNSYDNQVLFLASVNAYLTSLEGSVLNPNANNSVSVDVEAQRLAWESIGTDTSEWDEQQVKDNSFQSSVFVGGSIRFLDSMEDLEFKVNV